MTPLASPPLHLPCRGCGAALTPPPGEAYITCSHCGTTGFVDLAGLLRHLRTRPRITERELPRLLRAKGFEDPIGIELAYHPFWEFGWRGRALAIDAAPDEAPELDPLVLPTGERLRWDDEAGAGARAHRPTLVPEAAAALASAGLRGMVESSAGTRVHHPLYRITLPSGDSSWVDGVEGRILAGDSTGSAEPRRGAAGLALLVLGSAAAAIALPLTAAAGLAIFLAAGPALLRLVDR